MFDYDAQLEIIRRTEVELTNVTQKYTEILSKLSKDTLINLNVIYASKKIDVLKNQTPKGLSKEELETKKNSEYEKYKRVMEIYIFQNYGINVFVDSIEYNNFINRLKEFEKENPYSATNMLETYKKELLQTYLAISPTVDIALPTHGIAEIQATKHRENQYLNEIIDGIYATSGKEILDYIIRTNTGTMRGYGNNLDLPINPFSGIKNGDYLLNEPASVYHLDAKLFEPVIDFRLDESGNVNLRFDQEWISRNEKLKCHEEIVTYLPKGYIEKKNITIQGIKLDYVLSNKMGDNINLNEVNEIIEKLEKNIHFKDMLVNPNELNDCVGIAKNLKTNYAYLPSKNLSKYSLTNKQVNCNDYKSLIVNFYASIGIPTKIINKAFSSITIDKNINRARKANGTIYMHENDQTFGWIETICHEIAHWIREYAKDKQVMFYKFKKLFNKNEKFDDGLIAEIESKKIEDLFCQYLIENNIKIINEKGNSRPLTDEDIELQKLIEMNREKEYVDRIIEENNIINILNENFKQNKNYKFTQNQYDVLLSKYGSREIIRMVNNLKNVYLSDDLNFNYNKEFDLKNGRHIMNEFRFVIARIFNENTKNDSKINKNFGKYLLNGKIRTKEKMMSYFNIKSFDELAQNLTRNYNELNDKYTTRNSIDNVNSKEELSDKAKNTHSNNKIVNEQKITENKNKFNERSKTEIEIANQIKEKNIKIKQQKETEKTK